MPEPHLFVDISAHGFGHLAQVAPVLDVLTGQLPGLRISIRSGLSKARLQARLSAPFSHLPGSSDSVDAARAVLGRVGIECLCRRCGDDLYTAA